MEPGRDLAVVGFRKNPVCEYLVPSLTSFEVSLEDYDRRLGEIVLDQLASAGQRDRPAEKVWMASPDNHADRPNALKNYYARGVRLARTEPRCRKPPW